ncbi:MAG TPA: hypothetical protein VMF91_27485 [Bryobacteraceae bacterium]|nr:hypothetical protein [Bryobacteraceae bacterium]
MTRRQVILTASGIASPAFLNPQIIPGDFTQGMLNGRGWNRLPLGQKTCFLLGMTEALIFVRAAEMALNSEARKIHEAIIDPFDLPTVNNDELAGKVDNLYTDAANANIPVIEIVTVASMVFRGKKQSDIDDYITTLRASRSAIK